MSSDPYNLWTLGYISGETPQSPGVPSPGSGRRLSYSSMAASRSRYSTRAGAVSTLPNPSPSRQEEYPAHGRRNHSSGMRPQHRDVMGRESQASRAALTWHQVPKPPMFEHRSRVFDHFMTRDGLSEAASPLLQDPEPPRVAPSYLQGTEYMKRLDERYERNAQAWRDMQNGGGLPSRSNSQTPHASKEPPPSHRGMTLNVVEKAPGTPVLEENKEDVSLLPTGWNKDDKHAILEIAGNGCEVRHTGSKNATDKDHENSAVRADQAMPGQCGIYYFEITVLNTKRDDTIIIIGFGNKDVSLSRAPGWEADSWAYHGDDGHIYASQTAGKPYGPKFGQGDTVGCLVNFRSATVTFTKNGKDLGLAFRDNVLRQKGKFFPIVGLKKPGDHIIANFGQVPFAFDIDGYVQAEKDKIWEKIRQTDTRNLVPGLSEKELCQKLVLQHLQHDGYVETARAFAEEMVDEKRRLRLDPNEPIKGISLKDDEDAVRRQQIRRAVLEGDIDLALKLTSSWYPKVLKDHQQVYFGLRCRKYIEMVRKDAEQKNRSKLDAPDAVPVTKTVALPQFGQDEEMEIERDGCGYVPHEWDEQMEDDQPANPVAGGNLLDEAVQYGQELYAEFGDSTDPEVTSRLNEVFSVIAYPDPFKEEKVAHLLDRSGRISAAEELNSAILLSLGKQSRSALETMYADTVVLLESLREDSGSDGAFVSITDILDRIPKPTPLL